MVWDGCSFIIISMSIYLLMGIILHLWSRITNQYMACSSSPISLRQTLGSWEKRKGNTRKEKKRKEMKKKKRKKGGRKWGRKRKELLLPYLLFLWDCEVCWSAKMKSKNVMSNPYFRRVSNSGNNWGSRWRSSIPVEITHCILMWPWSPFKYANFFSWSTGLIKHHIICS